MFGKVLVANRGEIAVRVMRTCALLGIRTVGVYSEADRGALHVRMADEALPIGPAPAGESYLRPERLLAAARDSRAEAIHPGYGFLAENAEFARKVEAAGLGWIGPPAEVIELMGDKPAARRLAEDAGVPVVPGSSPLEDPKRARQRAEQVGYPVLVKAVAGGGGKGMRVVKSPRELAPALERARSEARRSFGAPEVYLEKFVPHAKHLEVQVLSDVQGNHVWLGERECTLQRRHQKLIEETPAAVLSQAQRERMGEAAVALARRCGYVNAGTVEFLFDAEEEKFYFLEMNTRLQVEHPVTEAVSGLDLVAWQLRVAAGQALPWSQEGPSRQGVALECRIYAEDPVDFLPSTGRLSAFWPPEGEGLRVDSGVGPGDRVSPFYDPLLAKLIAHGKDRAQAIQRMKEALDRFAVAGVVTNLALQRAVLEEVDFQRGTHLTSFLDTHALEVGLPGAAAQALAPAVASLERARAQGLVRALSAAADGWPTEGAG